MTLTFRTNIPNKDEYFQLFQSTGWNPNGTWTKDILYEAVKNSWYIVTVYKDDKLVASGRIISDGFVQCFICEMMVLPEYQNQGLGKSIMINLINHCKSKGIRWIQLACATGKKGFYEKIEFQERPADAPGMNLFL
ncbi:GNAT family N-acetyltransferase [Effusibacillus lacus]|uniref:N-acetyltransferase n=1 Tax=Effusibacillus lacus TaxID=1348429 RepID=A0A292YQR6_9BACL|nr:GNAT family N-acetyltransferase [Effusibacillus lacus]TCS74156.1 acetyltransferase (GNAT) family protein [Effusibacillus lacus]GAX90845.1 N-acetyltransferase [Effusibacillus lacus]